VSLSFLLFSFGLLTSSQIPSLAIKYEETPLRGKNLLLSDIHYSQTSILPMPIRSVRRLPPPPLFPPSERSVMFSPPPPFPYTHAISSLFPTVSSFYHHGLHSTIDSFFRRQKQMSRTPLAFFFLLRPYPLRRHFIPLTGVLSSRCAPVLLFLYAFFCLRMQSHLLMKIKANPSVFDPLLSRRDSPPLFESSSA